MGYIYYFFYIVTHSFRYPTLGTYGASVACVSAKLSFRLYSTSSFGAGRTKGPPLPLFCYSSLPVHSKLGCYKASCGAPGVYSKPEFYYFFHKTYYFSPEFCGRGKFTISIFVSQVVFISGYSATLALLAFTQIIYLVLLFSKPNFRILGFQRLLKINYLYLFCY